MGLTSGDRCFATTRRRIPEKGDTPIPNGGACRSASSQRLLLGDDHIVRSQVPVGAALSPVLIGEVSRHHQIEWLSHQIAPTGVNRPDLDLTPTAHELFDSAVPA